LLFQMLSLSPVGPTAIARSPRLSNRRAAWHGFCRKRATDSGWVKSRIQLGCEEAASGCSGCRQPFRHCQRRSSPRGACRRNDDLHNPDPVRPSRLPAARASQPMQPGSSSVATYRAQRANSEARDSTSCKLVFDSKPQRLEDERALRQNANPVPLPRATITRLGRGRRCFVGSQKPRLLRPGPGPGPSLLLSKPRPREPSPYPRRPPLAPSVML
jgi:hypothetical protein